MVSNIKTTHEKSTFKEEIKKNLPARKNLDKNHKSQDITSKDSVRDKLLATGLDVFGRYGFEGTSTRMIANKAGVNLQAIAYYFNNKEGLYLSTVQQLIDQIHSMTLHLHTQITERLNNEKQPVSKLEAQEMLYHIFSIFLDIVTKPEGAIWVRFIIREQMEPGAAFEAIYSQYMQNVLQLIIKLVAIIKGQPETSQQIQLRTFSLVGSLLILRIGNAALLRQMQWQEFNETALTEMRVMIKSLIQEMALEPTL